VKRKMALVIVQAFTCGIMLALLPSTGRLANARADNEQKTPAALSASDALGQLLQGNARYVSGQTKVKNYVQERARLARGQQPYAIILTCSDSRVAPEIVFDESLGKLFVVRVAGNVADPVVLASVEYAAEHLHAPLLLLMGHDSCGAVQASLDPDHWSPNLATMVKYIAPAARQAKRKGLDQAQTLDAAVRENVLLQAKRVAEESTVLSDLVEKKKLEIAGAVYHLESGKVEIITGQKAEKGERK
jgi:carbonic anhydrase